MKRVQVNISSGRTVVSFNNVLRTRQVDEYHDIISRGRTMKREGILKHESLRTSDNESVIDLKTDEPDFEHFLHNWARKVLHRQQRIRQRKRLLEIKRQQERYRQIMRKSLDNNYLESMIPTFEYQSNIHGKVDKFSEPCSICLEKFVDNEIIATLPCLHVYHHKCVIQSNKDTCPICRCHVS